MKIKFEFEIADLTKAGLVQKYLKDNNISFDMCEAKSKTKIFRYPRLTMDKVEQIRSIAKEHKRWNYSQVADAAGSGHEVTRKVLNGSHPILKGNLKAVK